jgi:hypothetical protein
VINLVGFVLGVREQFFELGDILPGFAEIEGAEILVEVVVDEILDGRGDTLSMLK